MQTTEVDGDTRVLHGTDEGFCVKGHKDLWDKALTTRSAADLHPFLDDDEYYHKVETFFDGRDITKGFCDLPSEMSGQLHCAECNSTVISEIDTPDQEFYVSTAGDGRKTVICTGSNGSCLSAHISALSPHMDVNEVLRSSKTSEATLTPRTVPERPVWRGERNDASMQETWVKMQPLYGA